MVQPDPHRTNVYALNQPAYRYALDVSTCTDRAFDEFIDKLLCCNRSTDLAIGECYSDGVKTHAAPSPTPSVASRPQCQNNVKPKSASRSSMFYPSEVESIRGKQLRAPPNTSWFKQTRLVRRPLSNDTYLRRLHLSPEQAISLLPCLAPTVLPLATSTERRARLNFRGVNVRFKLVNESGRQWNAVCECVLSSDKKQLHCRFGGGWRQFCGDNGVCVHSTVILERIKSNPRHVLVKLQ